MTLIDRCDRPIGDHLEPRHVVHHAGTSLGDPLIVDLWRLVRSQPQPPSSVDPSILRRSIA